MNGNNHSRFFHHFMSKQMPCIILPSSMTSSIIVGPTSPPSAPCPSNDHILNLSASMKKHCPMPNSPKAHCHHNEDSTKSDTGLGSQKSNLARSEPDCSNHQDYKEKTSVAPEDQQESLVDVNSNNLEIQKPDKDSCENKSNKYDKNLLDDRSESSESESGELVGPLSDIDVDENSSDTLESVSDFRVAGQLKHDEEYDSDKNHERKSKLLAFGIDRILSLKTTDNKDQTSLSTASVAPSFASPGSPRVVSSLSAKSENPSEAEAYWKDDTTKHHIYPHSMLSKLKLCSMQSNSENHKRSTSLPYFHHHPYGPYRHHNHHHMTPIITSSSGGIQNQNSHSLSHCSECLFLRRYCGGASSHTRSSNIPSPSSSSTSTVVTNNMQFSSPLTTPCGPSSSSISASFTWMANPSIYDNSAVISPVTGFNQHIPLQPSFGMSAAGFSTLATIHPQCSSGGGGGRRKRSWSRAVFSNLQRKGLEKRFQLQKYITKPDRRQLAESLGLTDAQVKVWFQNRRMKWRHTNTIEKKCGDNASLVTSSSSPPVSSTTPTKPDGATKDKKRC